MRGKNFEGRMDYQIDDLLDEDKCYSHLLHYFHGGHLRCPVCQGTHYHAHESHRKPIVQYKGVSDLLQYFQ